ncbi:hypothetical protein G9A89_014419 [Geosiphon pyriformis]|nr:hypothetical protein G9A89_014419 [Geosiphon pyriformis]
MQGTYMLQDATVQATDKLIEYLWCCEIVGINCLNLVQVSMEVSQVLIPKSGGGSGDQSSDGIDDRELNPLKYSPYGPNNSVFLCLLWNGNHPNADVTVDGNAFVNDMWMVLPGKVSLADSVFTGVPNKEEIFSLM